MDHKKTNKEFWALKSLLWPLLILIIIGGVAIFWGINMHSMQMRQISKLSKYVDDGEINKVDHLVKKDMILTQNFLMLSFIISVFCLITIIVFLFISYLIFKRKMKIKYNANEADVKKSSGLP